MGRDFRKTLQGNIKRYRLLGKRDGVKHCKSSAAFAKYIGLPWKTYKNYESGVSVPDYGNLIKIAAALGMPSMDKLLGYEPASDYQIRFFLEDLGISFRTKENGGHKVYTLDLPEKIKNDVRTWERMTLDVDAAEVTIYDAPALRRWKYGWFGKGKISFREDDFQEIVSIFHEHEGKLKRLAKYLFARQLLFLGLAKSFDDLNVGEPDKETYAEYSNTVSFLLDLETFLDDIRKARAKSDWYEIRKENDTWVQSDYLTLQDKMNSDLNSEQLREIFLDMLEDVYKDDGRGGVKIIRQRIQNKK